MPLAEQRRGAVLAAVRATGARRVGDLGCGEGDARPRPAGRPDDRAASSPRTCRRGRCRSPRRRLRLERMTEQQRRRLELFQSSLTYRDDRLAGLDAAVLMEVIEHVDPPRLGALERAVFGHAAPCAVVVTTPNVEHNVRFETLPAGSMRHRDHRFEWTRAQFEEWANRVAARYGYAVRFLPVGAGRPRGRPADPARALHQGRGMTRESRTCRRLSPGRARRRQRFGQVDVRPRRTSQPTEVISSDFCRGLVVERRERPGGDAGRLRRCCTTSSACGWPPGCSPSSTRPTCSPRRARSLVALAREHDVLPAAIVLDVPRAVCVERNAGRPDRDFGAHVIRRQREQLRRSLRGLAARGIPHRPHPARRAGDRRRRRSSAPGCTTTGATTPARST